MSFEETPPLATMIATKLRQTHRDPAEWIGDLRDGRKLHIAATKSALLISVGIDLNDALMKAKKGDTQNIRHNQINRAVTTLQMLETTGLNLGPGVEVNERVPGDIG